jgi:hypothetical protein
MLSAVMEEDFVSDFGFANSPRCVLARVAPLLSFLSRATVLDDPDTAPWEDLRRFTSSVEKPGVPAGNLLHLPGNKRPSSLGGEACDVQMDDLGYLCVAVVAYGCRQMQLAGN